MRQVVIVGGGPVRISATVVAGGMGALEKVGIQENCFGLKESPAGAELIARGHRQAERLGVSIVRDEVVNHD